MDSLRAIHYLVSLCVSASLYIDGASSTVWPLALIFGAGGVNVLVGCVSATFDFPGRSWLTRWQYALFRSYDTFFDEDQLAYALPPLAGRKATWSAVGPLLALTPRVTDD